MSLQNPAINLSNVLNPMCGLHEYSITLAGLNNPTNSSKLDPITEQMVKTNDARLEVMNRFESGAICQWWKKEKRLHSGTIVGEMMDWLCGWGKYHSQTESPDAESKSPVLGKQDGTRDAKPKLTSDCSSTVFSEKIITSFEGRLNLNKSCMYSRPIEYYTKIENLHSEYSSGASKDIICKVRACVREKLMNCHPYCFPCLNATESEIIEISEPISDFLVYGFWYLFVNRTWVRIDDYHLNKWKQNQIIKLFKETVEDCECLLFSWRMSCKKISF
jgi:hypothetical protein